MLNEYEYEEGVTSPADAQFWEYFEAGPAPPAPPAADEEPRDQAAVLITYSVLLVVGGVGNVAVLLALTRTRRRRSRVDLLMKHLALADVAVTCGVIPLEIGWKYTNEWLAGNALCKLLQVMRAFGLYLSSNVLVCISLDRFFAVLYPLRLPVARRRSKQMLVCAWTAALACSLPQSVVFRVKAHPRLRGFHQCVAFDAFSSEAQEVAYNVFCMSAVYFVPLVVITVCYVCIAAEIRRSSHDLSGWTYFFGKNATYNYDRTSLEKCRGSGTVRLRRSDHRVLARARRRTLRMTVTIVSVFAVCWLPYVIIAMWYMVDRKSASHVSPLLQDLLFAMAVSNSCMNPLVYGSYSAYTLHLRNSAKKFFKSACCRSSAGSDTIGNSSSSQKSQRRNANPDVPLFTTKQNERRLGVRFAETSFTTSKAEPPRPRAPDREPPRPRGPA